MCAISFEPRLQTERLSLRPALREDAVWIADRINDYAVARMTTRVPHPFALADAEGFLERLDPRSNRAFLIEHPAFGAIGLVGLHDAPDPPVANGRPLPELGYWLGRTFWGQGFATEAVGAVLRWAGQGWGRRAVIAGHFADNPASGRVLEKVGFLYTGEVQPRFSVSRREVAPTRMMVWLA